LHKKTVSIQTSPIPSAIRRAMSSGKLVRAAIGVKRVRAEVQKTPTPNKVFPPNLRTQCNKKVTFHEKFTFFNYEVTNIF